jgi:transglutaminase-like putative cysteine protease
VSAERAAHLPTIKPATTGPGETTQRRVEHTTTYNYGGPVDNTYHLAALQPRPVVREQGVWINQQRVVAFALDVEPQPSHLESRIDAFGNVIHEFEVRRPHTQLRVHAASRLEVCTGAPAGPAQLAKTPPWEQVAQRLIYRKNQQYVHESEFIFASPRIQKSEALHSLALLEFWPHRPIAQAAFALMQRVYRDFRYQSGSTHVDTPLEEVLKTRTGVCQDFAHILIGALRGIGLPARYVSGYMLTEPPAGQARLVGADASHAWCSVWLGPDHGWMDLDPTNNKIPDERYVTVAIGRDYEDIPPIKGVLHGGGQHALTVAVTVD